MMDQRDLERELWLWKQRDSALMDWGFKPGTETGEKEEDGMCLPQCSS